MDLHKFAPCKYVANKSLKREYMAKMVNSNLHTKNGGGRGGGGGGVL